MTKQISENRWFGWALAVIIIVGFSVWGFAEYSGIKTESEFAQDVSFNRHRESVEKDTAGWQTYRNEEHGFEVKIPPTWENYSVRREEKIDSSSWGVDKNGSPIIQGKVATYIFELSTMQPDICQNNKCLIFSLSVFSNAQAEKIDFINGPFGFPIARNDNFTFALTGTSEDPPLDLIKFLKDVNQILSTFKFIK